MVPTQIMNQSASQQDTYFILRETFSEFRDFDGFQLPARWHLQLSIEGSQTTQMRWDVKLTRVVSNPKIDPADFELR